MNFPDFQEEWLEKAPRCTVPVKKVLGKSAPQKYAERGLWTALLLLPLFWVSFGPNTPLTQKTLTGVGDRSPGMAVGESPAPDVFEIVYLKSGQMLKGKILMQKRKILLVHTEDTEYILNSNNIRKIRYFNY